MSRPPSSTSEKELNHRSRAHSTPNSPASYLYEGYSTTPFGIQAARTRERAWETAGARASTRREPSPDDHVSSSRSLVYPSRGRQEFRRSSARRSTNPTYYHNYDRVRRMSEGDDLSRALENIDIGLATIEEETPAEAAVDTTAETPASDETRQSSGLSQLTHNNTTAPASSSIQNAIGPSTVAATETGPSENDLLVFSLNQLNLRPAIAEVISSSIKGKELSTTTARLSFLDDLDSLTDRGTELVVSIHPEFHNLGAVGSTLENPEPILVTYTSEIGEDKAVPLDSIPNILWSAAEVELLRSLHHPLGIQLDSGFAEMQEAMQQPAWLENEGGNPVPMTPLTHPFRPTKASESEKANGDVQIMHLEDFSPAEDHIPLEILKNTSRQAPPAFTTLNVRPQVNVYAPSEELETELGLNDVMKMMHNEGDNDDGEITEEESDSSVEIILENPGPMKARKLYHKSSSAGSIAGANYKFRNVSNFTLGDTTANQRLDNSTNSLPTTPSTRESVSAGDSGKGKSAAVKIVTPLTRKANTFTPMSKASKEPESLKRPPSTEFSDVDPFNKGKKIANSTGEESDFSIDVNLENCGIRGRTLSSPGPFSPNPVPRTTPSFTAAAPSGSKENNNFKGKAKKVADLLSSSASSRSATNKVISYASVAATPLPKVSPSYAEMLNSTPPSATAAITSSESSYLAPTRNFSEPKKGVRHNGDLALTKEKLSSMKARKAKPSILKATAQSAPPRSATVTTGAATTSLTAVGGSYSRLPIPTRTSSLPTRRISSVSDTYLRPPTINGKDTWPQTAWAAEREGTITTVGGSGFQPNQKKKGNKRKTGKATTKCIVSPDDAFSNLSTGQARVTPPGANYVDERDNERFVAGGSRRHKTGSARGGGNAGRAGSSDGGASGRVLKDYGEDGKGTNFSHDA